MQPAFKSLYNLQFLLIRCIAICIFLFTSDTGFSQTLTKNKYGLEIVTTSSQLKQIIVKDSSMQMADLKVMIPGIQMDLKYTTKDNFLKEPFYPTNITTTYLRLPAALALKRVQAELNIMGYNLKIWDAYRPYSATEKMWEPVKDDRYAADPKFGSGHNRGIAVDLTLMDLKTGKELNMGTGFDNFSDTAHSDYKNLPEEILANRKILRSAMERNGFKVLDTEWWHFFLPDSKKYALMDLSFKELQKISRQKIIIK